MIKLNVDRPPGTSKRLEIESLIVIHFLSKKPLKALNSVTERSISYICYLTWPHLISLQVNFSSSLDTGSSSASGSTTGVQSHLPLLTLSPIIHPRIREFRSGLGSARKGGCERLVCLCSYFWCETNFSVFFHLFQMCLPLRYRSMTGTALLRPAVPNGVSLATILLLQWQPWPSVGVRCRLQPRG